MKRCAFILAAILLTGCEDGPKPAPQMSSNAKPIPELANAAGSQPGKGSDAQKPGSAAAAESPNSGDLELSPANTRIEFVGTHSGDKPDPRLGGFMQFTGKAAIDPDSKLPTAVSFQIAADSIWTQMGDKLTGHLKSPDFFDVKEFPEIQFQSKQVEVQDAAAGKVTVLGDLTLHGVTKPISVPMTMSGAGQKYLSEFNIDRTEFGMTYGEGKVENAVSLTVVIGEKTEPKRAEATPSP